MAIRMASADWSWSPPWLRVRVSSTSLPALKSPKAGLVLWFLSVCAVACCPTVPDRRVAACGGGWLGLCWPSSAVAASVGAVGHPWPGKLAGALCCVHDCGPRVSCRSGRVRWRAASRSDDHPSEQGGAVWAALPHSICLWDAHQLVPI